MTITKIKGMTSHDIFIKVRDHLLKQKRKSMHGEEDRCLYRGPDGLKCAIGVLIKDEFYRERLEGTCPAPWSVTRGSKGLRIVLSKSLGVKELDFDMLGDLQSIHDDHDPLYWRKILDEYEVKKFGFQTLA